MKTIMCILFAPIYLVKLIIAAIFSLLAFTFLAIAMAFGADGVETQQLVNDVWEWACDYPPTRL